MITLLVGQVARAAGVGVGAVRMYERLGLIPPAPRTEAGYRRYPEDTVLRIQFIRSARGLGFTLKELQPLFTRGLAGVTGAALFSEKLAQVEERIRGLEGMRELLLRLKKVASKGIGRTECVLYRTALEFQRDLVPGGKRKRRGEVGSDQ